MKRLRLVASVVTGLLVAVAVGLLVYAILGNQDFAHGLAQERKESIVRACDGQNMRHDATVKELDSEFARFEAEAPPSKQAELAASKGFALLLIDRLAPHQDCKQVLAKSTSTK